ncbi:T9SS type A sorting domain-containing protein [candidate division KSB1 bacterium]|nr:T9SS type A sorting domain-containing protein [candidate division KSB1 bacterium]
MKYLYYIFLFLIIIPSFTYSQIVQGTITDPLIKKGIPNLTVTIDDCTAVTDSLGHYEINLGNAASVETGKNNKLVPKEYALFQNYPNPFNSETTISFQLPKTSNVTIKIYNIFGQEIKSFSNRKIQAGSHKFIWDGSDNYGSTVSSGIYIVYFSAQDFQKSIKVLLLK